MKEIELKPCPFCGNEIIAYRGTYVWGLWYVGCERCGVNFPAFPTRERAFEAWNRRADNEQREAD